jgi:plasmid stabilization system protein ParE
MNLTLHRAEAFEADVAAQFEWYFDEAGDRVAWRFFAAVDSTLVDLARHPGLGRLRRFRHPALRGLRSFRVKPPFDRHLVFYRNTDRELSVERLMHGRRDLPRRLRKPLADSAD